MSRLGVWILALTAIAIPAEASPDCNPREARLNGGNASGDVYPDGIQSDTRHGNGVANIREAGPFRSTRSRCAIPFHR